MGNPVQRLLGIRGDERVIVGYLWAEGSQGGESGSAFTLDEG